MAVLVISYSRVDQPQVRAVVSLLKVALRDVQKAVFWDGELEPGDPWFEQIKQHIDAAPQLFVFWCDHSARSQQVRREFIYAITQKKRVVPVLLDDTALAPELAAIHGIDLRGAIHHDSSLQPSRPAALSAPSTLARQALSILVVLVSLGVVAALAVVVGSVSFLSPGVWAFTAIVVTLALLVRYLVKSRRRQAVAENVEGSDVQFSSDAFDRIVSEFSRHIDESRDRFPD